MKLPVIRGRIGDWVYYSGVMTFKQITEHVKPSINEIYDAVSLEELLQRELTENYKSIQQYLLKDNERFFNAIILAIYNGDPRWLEVEFPENERDYTNVGFLQFTGKEQIFPVDGQHRVKGIVEALKVNTELSIEQVPVIFIAHKQTPEGRKRTRKLFSTLNRRNKPVGTNENIALDEDDICSIITRELIQSFPLFSGENVANTKNKSIPTSNKKAITSVITLYQVVEVLVKWKYNKDNKKKMSNDFKLYRPSNEMINEYLNFVFCIMQSFVDCTDVIRDYLFLDIENKAEKYRNASGGNILFRPIVLTEYFSTMIIYSERHQCSFEKSFAELNRIEKSLDSFPWIGFLWDGKKIINRTARSKIRLLLMYLVDSSMLKNKELEQFFSDYATTLNISLDHVKDQFETGTI